MQVLPITATQPRNNKVHFKATLKMPEKALFERYCGNVITEQVEKARPALEKLAKETTITSCIRVYPYGYDPCRPVFLPIRIRESLTVSALTKDGREIGNPNVRVANPETLPDAIIQELKKAMQAIKEGTYVVGEGEDYYLLEHKGGSIIYHKK